MKPLIKFLRLRKFHFLDKQERFVFQTIISTGVLLIAQLIWQDFRLFMLLALALFSYLLTAWSLKEDIVGIEWVLLFVLPVFFTLSMSLFYFLLPGRWISRLIISSIFALGIYAIIRAENIYNVAGERSIQLLRVAQTVGLLITLVVVFFSTIVVFSLRTSFFINVLILTPMIFILALQSLWTIKLETKLTQQLVIYSLIIGLIIGEIVSVLSFWPIFKSSGLAISALFITSIYYFLVGIIQQYMMGRMFTNTIREYIIPFLFMLTLLFTSTKWG